MNNKLDELTLLFVGLKFYGRVTWPWWECVWPSVLNVAVQIYFWYAKKQQK